MCMQNITEMLGILSKTDKSCKHWKPFRKEYEKSDRSVLIRSDIDRLPGGAIKSRCEKCRAEVCPWPLGSVLNLQSLTLSGGILG